MNCPQNLSNNSTGTHILVSNLNFTYQFLFYHLAGLTHAVIYDHVKIQITNCKTIHNKKNEQGFIGKREKF